MNTPTTPIFQTGTTYSCRSVCDHNCVWHFEVVRRTAKSIWIKGVDGGVKRKAISHYSDGGEMVYPLGRYSMCPTLVA